MRNPDPQTLIEASDAQTRRVELQRRWLEIYSTVLAPSLGGPAHRPELRVHHAEGFQEEEEQDEAREEGGPPAAIGEPASSGRPLAPVLVGATGQVIAELEVANKPITA